MGNVTRLVLLVVAGGFIALSVAGPPADGKGKVLVLENERVLEGDVEKVGNQYLVRRTLGETWVPAEKTLALCQNKEEAYRFLRGRANLHDADEHLRLAQWCHLNGLPAAARAEVEEAVKLRPNHRPSQRLLAHLQQMASADSNPTAAQTADQAEPSPALAIDLTEEALGQFATRVQPILMNACAGCHANGKGGAFKLTRTYEATLTNRKAVQRNLAAVLAQVNATQPFASPLLAKSVSVHGEMNQSPLKSRQAAAYRTIEEWVRRTLDSNPQLREPGVAPLPAPLAPMAKSSPPVRVVPTMPVKSEPGANPEPARTLPTLPANLPRADEKPTQPAEPKPADAFDPDEFNKQAPREVKP